MIGGAYRVLGSDKVEMPLFDHREPYSLEMILHLLDFIHEERNCN